MNDPLPKHIATCAYPPDGVPFARIAALAHAYAVMLGEGALAPIAAPHLAAWGVVLGVITRQQASAAIKQAREAGDTPQKRLADLARLLGPLFADCGNVEVLSIKLKTLLPGPPSIDDATWKLASQLAHGLAIDPADAEQRDDPTAAAIRVAMTVRADRLELVDAWALVAEARRLNPEDPEQAFHSLVYWIERLRLLAERPPAPPAATYATYLAAGFFVPSAN